ncbi:hypothetical protein [Variovorax sp. UC74_104]|uniref:hypothetical protein n=1 Tax=Variovorax sp. UC74_104 TaxID=3374555 RepID=UPI003757F9F6
MSVRSGMAELRREFEQLRSGLGGVIGLAERMFALKADRLASGKLSAPPTRDEMEETTRTSPPDSLRHKMAVQALRAQQNDGGIDR